MSHDDRDGFVDFEITENDIEQEFDPFRSRRSMSKNQAIYGIWADSESDDEGGEGKDFNKKRKKTDYTTQLNFVKSEKKLQDQINDGEQKVKHREPNNRPWSGSMSSSFVNSDAEFGQWEMYTKGVGSKLLQKMGYQPGKGLGKNLQGIIEPIEAKKRPGAGSIGLYGPEASRKPRKGNDEESMETKEVDRENTKQNWKKNQKEKIKKIEIYNKSTEDIIAESVKKSWNNENTDLIGVKIIDMTGPEQRVLSGLTQLHQSKPEKPKSDYEITPFNRRFDIPELKKNIERLVLLSEKNLVKLKRNHDRNQRTIEDFHDERERLRELLKTLQEQLFILESLSNFVESIEEDLNDAKKLSFEKTLNKFETLLTEDFKQKIKSIKLDHLILCAFGQILANELRTWHPFDSENQSNYYFQLFNRLKSLVNRSKTFEILLWEHWNPIVCRNLQCWHSIKNYDPIISFLIQWQPLIPKWMFEYFIVNALIPKLHAEVDEWNPLTDVVPVHSWIHPWLPLIAINDEYNGLFEPIYETIRKKLANALTKWHPSDSSARLILEPWINVFTDSSLQTFLDVNIVPKLEKIMQTFVINPSQQSLNEWNWVSSWISIVSFNTIVSILERHFFPKWLNVLYVWLGSGSANFNEISSWYQGWKTLMGDRMINHPTIKEFLRKALIMMDHAVNLNTGLQDFQSYYNPRGQTMSKSFNETKTTDVSINRQPIDSSEEKINFRQMIEMKAQEQGILFLPIVNRFESGHQVFKFGPYLIYIDNQVIFQQKFVQGKKSWQPIMINNLIDLCHNQNYS
ncbi:Tuftelin-interacting protein 11 [Sarcoptes scabiei]|uniref:Tuftelin-interacting protein 11 n=1 Tax=Sarcoptes scabiei TaxID=52283 RepID=A0A834VD63_SARSC|nr:Tuftelin-interacting protein 11 [Sarcoptes scabiei]UXI16262.1 Growth arrest-specific protein 1 [Sarcoptes scabiei]